jgi:putative transcriptional regulator
MTTKRKFKSDAFEAIHSSASALHRVGAISKTTMREFDESCLIESRAKPREPTDFRALLEHQRIDCAKVGDRRETSEWYGASFASDREEAWDRGIELSASRWAETLDAASRRGPSALGFATQPRAVIRFAMT